MFIIIHWLWSFYFWSLLYHCLLLLLLWSLSLFIIIIIHYDDYHCHYHITKCVIRIVSSIKSEIFFWSATHALLSLLSSFITVTVIVIIIPLYNVYVYSRSLIVPSVWYELCLKFRDFFFWSATHACDSGVQEQG